MSEVRVGEWSGVENRKHKRVPLHVAVECRQGQVAMQAHCENISVSGLLVRCTEPFAEDSELTISFQLPGDSHPIDTRARVAHMVPGVFMGLEFFALPTDSRSAIERYVDVTDPIAKARS